jgi:hypothetical protein
VLALTLALAACGGDDEKSDEPAASTGAQTAAETQPATTAEAADPAAEAEKAEEAAALGTMQALATAIDEDDEDVFCGLAMPELLDKLEKGLTTAGCLKGLEGKEFGRSLKGSKPVDVEVDDDVAAGRLRTRQGNFVAVVMRKRDGRWMVKKFD